MKNPAAKDDRFETLASETLTLKLIGFYEADGPQLPFYWYDIVLNATRQKVGKISIRLGHNFHSYYNGHIGYEIDGEFRGHGYAFEACRLVIPVAAAYGMTHLYLTCDEGNAASCRTIEKLGAALVETVQPPLNYFAYHDGMGRSRIYRYQIPTNCEMI